MDTSSPKPNTYKRVVPLKGSRLQKLKNALSQEFQNGKQHKHAENFSEFSTQFSCIVGLNRVKTEDSGKPDGVIQFEPLQEAKKEPKVPDNKIIIQKVEKVTYDVSSILFSPGKSGNSLPEASTSKAHVKQDDAIQEKSFTITQPSPEKPNGSTIVTLFSSTYPANEFNTKVPLKVVRTIKQPKPKPNLPKRVHRIQTFRPSQVPPAKLPQPEVGSEPVVPPPIVIKKEEPVAKKIIVKTVKSDTDSSDCCGFDVDSDDQTVTITKYYDFLKQESKTQNGGSSSKMKSEKESLTAVTIGSPVTATSPAKRITRLSSILKNKKTVEKPKPQDVPKVKSPEKPRKAEATPAVKKPVSNSWQNDILAVIGTSRLKEIDQMLKNIPNLIDGKFNPIEMENVELKLIIKHLMRKLKVESITDTLRPGDSRPSFYNGGLSFDLL